MVALASALRPVTSDAGDFPACRQNPRRHSRPAGFFDRRTASIWRGGLAGVIAVNESNRVGEAGFAAAVAGGLSQAPRPAVVGGGHVGNGLQCGDAAWVQFRRPGLCAKSWRLLVGELLQCQLADGLWAPTWRRTVGPSGTCGAQVQPARLITYMRYTGNLARCRRAGGWRICCAKPLATSGPARHLLQGWTPRRPGADERAGANGGCSIVTGEPRYLDFCKTSSAAWSNPMGQKSSRPC